MVLGSLVPREVFLVLLSSEDEFTLSPGFLGHVASVIPRSSSAEAKDKGEKKYSSFSSSVFYLSAFCLPLETWRSVWVWMMLGRGIHPPRGVCPCSCTGVCDPRFEG